MISLDLYLGTFLVLSGFALSLLNIRRLLKEVNLSFPAVLISENVLLMCIGIAFISKSSYEMNPTIMEMQYIEERIIDMDDKEITCNFYSIMKSYGPLIISLVNSFLSLVIDNYMHYRMLADDKKEDEQNTVQEFNQTFRNGVSSVSKLYKFAKKYFSYIAVILQWILPIIIALSMYPIEVKEQFLSMDEVRSKSDSCLAMVDATNETCYVTNLDANFSMQLRKFLPPKYIEAHETLLINKTMANEINSVINNVYQIIANTKNTTFTNVNVTSAPLWRKAKTNHDCMKVCYMDNKNLILYMFFVAVITYFIPITISTVILTKIHIMDVKRPNTKTYVSRELLYNMLFWTPVMFDTFVSILLCSYSMNGIRTSIFNVIANVYQAVKNFMNTMYFQDNSVKPI